MLKELYFCDRDGCENKTQALGNGEFFYADPGWVGIKTSLHDRASDFCSFECLGLWVDKKIKERREGGK